MTEVKKELPPMKNVGVMSRREMQELLRPLTNDARLVSRSTELMLTIRTPKGLDIVTCAHLGKNRWHVRAREGLIVTRIVPATV